MTQGIGTILLVIGIGIVVFGAFLAYDAYNTYKPVLPRAESLEQAITNTSYELVNLVLKLGFLGVMIWAGSVLLNHGVSALVELHKAERGVATRSEQQKQGS